MVQGVGFRFTIQGSWFWFLVQPVNPEPDTMNQNPTP